VTKTESAGAIGDAYRLQCTCDEVNRPAYLSALVKVAEENIVGKEDLQMTVMLERSMLRYTLGESFVKITCMSRVADCKEDLQQAYATIGYTVEHESLIGIDTHEAPDSYILELHKSAVQTCASSDAKTQIFEALKLIGRHRGSKEISDLANSGKTMMTVAEAYEALSCPMDAVDDGLIMYVSLLKMGNFQMVIDR
jgi:ubiquitin carboxyl-terminal hydrolase 25